MLLLLEKEKPMGAWAVWTGFMEGVTLQRTCVEKIERRIQARAPDTTSDALLGSI